jgi:bacterioferritin-associated ferredoxin
MTRQVSSQEQLLPDGEANQLKELSAKAVFLNRDHVELKLRLLGEKIISAEIKAIACPECLTEIKNFKLNLRTHQNDFSKLPLPEGSHHSAMLVREVLLRLRGEWEFPYKEEELCHCRNVATSKVDAAIMAGTFNVSEIGEKTMAGTACGTCRPVTQMIIDYRLNEP